MGNAIRVYPLVVYNGTPIQHSSVKLGLPVSPITFEEFAETCPEVFVVERLSGSVEEGYDAQRDTCRKTAVVSLVGLTVFAMAVVGALRSAL